MPDLPKQPRPRDPHALRTAWTDEYTTARNAREHTIEWVHLQRAHILSQPLVVAHLRTDLAMLSYGWRQHDRDEVIGQLGRLVVAGPGSAMRRYPLGNTGGADASAVVPMPVPRRPHRRAGARLRPTRPGPRTRSRHPPTPNFTSRQVSNGPAGLTAVCCGPRICGVASHVLQHPLGAQ